MRARVLPLGLMLLAYGSGAGGACAHSHTLPPPPVPVLYDGESKGAGPDAALSIDLVTVSTDFSGAEILIFGSAEPTDDVVVTVRGPRARAQVQHKKSVAGIWLNAEKQTYPSIPGYYHVASSRPVAAFVSPADQEHLGLDFLRLEEESTGRDGSTPSAAFRAALIDDMMAQGLYGQSPRGVRFVGDRLFRVDLRLPPRVPVGTFGVTIYAFRDGAMRGMTSTSFLVDKVGLGRTISDLAHDYPLLYGILAVVAAIGLGAVAAVVFRRV